MSESTIRDRIIDEATATLDQGGPEPWATEMGLKLGPNDEPEWCGIWARAIWRRQGLVVQDWQIGKGNGAGLVQVASHLAEPGDLIFWKGKKGHQSLFLKREGLFVYSIDGNTTKYDGPKAVAFETIAFRKRPASEVLAVYMAPIPEGA